MSIKLGDVAAVAGVSKATASLAMNGSTLVKAETRENVLRIAKEMNYIPDHNARSLVSRKSGIIGVVVPDIESEYYGRLVSCIDRAIRENGFSMLLALSNDDRAQEAQAVKNFVADNVEGVIIIPINKQQPEHLEHLQLLDAYHIPYVFSSSYYLGAKEKCVMVDLELGSYYLARYLLNMGRKNILFFCGSPQIIPTITRVRGIERAFEEKGERLPEKSIVVFNEINYSGAYSYVLNNIRNLAEVDAIITVNDMMALGVINALREQGITVPEKIAVAGYDNVAYSVVAPIPITTVNQDLQRVGMDTVNMLVGEIASEAESTHEEDIRLISPELLIRSST